MTDFKVARPFLEAELQALEPLGFVAVIPSANLLHAVELMRAEEAGFEVRLPGRVPGLPGLPPATVEWLEQAGFTSEDPADGRQPWVLPARDAGTALDWLQRILTEALEVPADAPLDVGHGSRRIEYEARKKLAVARTRIEGIVRDMLGHDPEQDKDEDYLLPVGDVHVVIAPRAAPDGQVVVRVFVITNVGVQVTPELGLFLARLNFNLMFGRFALDAEHRSIWFDETLLGEHFREEELRFTIGLVASTADGWDNRLKQMFGGQTYQEVLASRNAEALPDAKPGEGNLGQYL